MKKWLVISVYLTALPAWASVPPQITYQGTLKQSGAVANGIYTMIFRLTDSTGRNQYWNSGPQQVSVNQGLFSTVLSPSGIDWSKVTPYIEVTINGQALLPRDAVTSTAYSLMSGGVADGSVTTAALADGSITIAKLANGVVTATKLSADVQGAMVPSGMIALFTGPCPSGWLRFDALDNVFPIGGRNYGATGGSATHSHGISLDGAHNHSGWTGPPNDHQASDAGLNFESPVGNHTHSISVDGAHDHGGNTGLASSLPPYLTVVFCQKQ